MSKWGILPFVKRVIQLTNHTFDEVMNMPVCTVFYLTCFELDLDAQQKAELEKWKRTH